MAENFTDWIQRNRFTVVGVDRQRGHVRIKSHEDACSDISCGPGTVVVGDDGPAGLDALNPGDIVRLEGGLDRPARIVVVRRVWDELTSPEF
jgi:hypothetical protein